jgi:hypothetical protein
MPTIALQLAAEAGASSCRSDGEIDMVNRQAIQRGINLFSESGRAGRPRHSPSGRGKRRPCSGAGEQLRL